MSAPGSWRVAPLPGPPQRAAHGIGVLAVIIVLVVLSALAAAVLRLSRQDQNLTSQDIDGLRVSTAARAGIEFGIYQALKGPWGSCAGSTQTLNLLGSRVTVVCQSTLYNEGESSPGVPQTVRVYSIDAVACNGPSTCPDASAAAGENYVERRRQAQVVN